MNNLYIYYLFLEFHLRYQSNTLFLSFLHAAFTNVCSYSSYHRFLFHTISRMLHLLTDNCIFITISVKRTLEMTICHQTDIFIFIHIFITYITFIVFIINIISTALTTDSLISAHLFIASFFYPLV